MSDVFDKINSEVILAAKNRDSERLLVLRTLVSDIKGVALKASRKDIVDDDVLTALTKAVKQREDSISQFKSANRVDLVESESFQLNVLKEFLPAQLSEKEVEAIVFETVSRISEGKERNKKLMGAIMKELNPRLKGKADMRVVNNILSALLA